MFLCGNDDSYDISRRGIYNTQKRISTEARITDRKMNVCVVGTGYVGLVTGAVFADLGNEVVCVDKDESKVSRLRQGIMPIYEPGLEEMVKRNMEEGRLSFTQDLGEGVRKGTVIFIAVGTPPKITAKPIFVSWKASPKKSPNTWIATKLS